MLVGMLLLWTSLGKTFSFFFFLQSHHRFNFVYISSHLHRCWWSCIFASMSIATFLLRSAGPPVNVTCNIFINSFGSVTETTMVSATIMYSFHIALIFHDHTSLVNISVWLHFANVMATFEFQIITSEVILFILFHLALVPRVLWSHESRRCLALPSQDQ